MAAGCGLDVEPTSTPVAATNPAANLDQCANGPLDAPVVCAGSAWSNQNLNPQQAHYVEGESVPYRLRFSDLAGGGAVHAVRIEWDTAESGGTHALDYLTTFSRSETDAEPCSGVAGCAGWASSTYAIPTDPRVAAGADGSAQTVDDIVQAPGVFTLYGGVILSVSADYAYEGAFTGRSTAGLTITFTASAPNAVLAWGGHISLRFDWSPALTAVDIAGSPYHMRLLDLDGAGGNQDRSLSAAAVYRLPELVVVKHVVNDHGRTATAGDFTMTVTGPAPDPASFPGDELGTHVIFDEPGAYAVGESGPSGYAATYSADCTGTIAYDDIKTCTVTNDDVNLCWGVVCAPPAGECLQEGVCDEATGECVYAPRPAGTACTGDGNVCTLDVCDEAGACSHPAGHAGTLCRDAAGVCDVPEHCTGTAIECPADGFRAADFECRASAGVCDPAETCTGAAADCPADALRPASFECRASAGVCDAPESCTGAGVDCPADGFLAATTECRAAADVCDVAELCTGGSAHCPLNAFMPSPYMCRASAGECDAAEVCTGSSAACPEDAFKPATYECRASAGVCDVPEHCTGSDPTCPVDAMVSYTHQCRPSEGPCDLAENCTGSDADCPADAFRPASYECRASEGICDVPELCTGAGAACPDDAFLPGSETCRASAGVCDVPELCTGAGAACPDDAFLPATDTCRASAGVCDVPELCTGAGAACPEDAFLPATDTCRASAGICDVPELCTGAGEACPDDAFLPATRTCRASAGVCDLPELCTGSGVDCPADAFAPATEVCRAEAGECDVPELCTGAGAACPADGLVAAGTVCRPEANDCDPPEACDGAGPACPPDVCGSCRLCADKFYDADADGEYDPEELGVAGWRFVLSGGDAPLVASSQAGGVVEFADLALGDYLLCEAAANEAGWMQTAPPEVCVMVHVPSTDAESCVLDFGNLCLGAGGGRTPGYWSNKVGYLAFLGSDGGAGSLALLNGLNLRRADGQAFDPLTVGDFRVWLLDSTAVNMAYKLSSHVAAMALNLHAGFVDPTRLVFAPGAAGANDLGFLAIDDLLAEANAELGLHGWTPEGNADRAYQAALKDGLDAANNNRNFVQGDACAVSFPLMYYEVAIMEPEAAAEGAALFTTWIDRL